MLVVVVLPFLATLCAIWLLWVLLIERREWVNGAILMAGGLAGLTITIAWLAISTGGVSLFAKIVTDIPSSNAANQYAIEYQSGPGYLLLRALEIMRPVAAVLGLVGCGATCATLACYSDLFT